MTHDSNVGDCAQTPTWIKPMLLFIKTDSYITGIIGLSSYVSKFFSRREVFLSLKLSFFIPWLYNVQCTIHETIKKTDKGI